MFKFCVYINNNKTITSIFSIVEHANSPPANPPPALGPCAGDRRARLRPPRRAAVAARQARPAPPAAAGRGGGCGGEHCKF